MIEPPRGYADGVQDKPAAPPFWDVVKWLTQHRLVRHLLAANVLISFAGYAGIAWVPVYLQRVHGMGTGESATILALAIGIGGGIGTFFGGYLADRLAKRGEGWRAWVVCASLLLYIPCAYLSFSAQDPFWAAAWFFGPATLGGVYIGTNFAILQSMLPIQMRAVGAAINLFLLNIIGLGLGPLCVGIISDVMAGSAGVDSIRYGLLAMIGVMLWGGWHEWRTGVLLNRLSPQTG